MIRPFGISVFLMLAVLASTAEAQLIRIGPYGGVRLWAPGARLSIPGPVGPPAFPSPLGISPFYGPPVPAPGFRYRANRVPTFVPRAVYVPRATYPPPASPRFEMEFYGPGGSGSISVGSTPLYPPARAPMAQVEYQPADPLDLESHLYDSAMRLTHSLTSRRDGDPWLNYLAPHRITAALARGEQTALEELVDHYNGVAANPKLSTIANLDGFAETRRLLPRYLESLAGPSPPAETGVVEREVTLQPLSEQDNGESLLPMPEPLANEFEPQPDPNATAEPQLAPEATLPESPAPEPTPLPEPQAIPEPQPALQSSGPSPALEIQPADGSAAN